jgi:pimeloyl-ACP methyl ester carboxylesterase
MNAPTVVLVHGAFTDSSSWNEVISRLDEDGIPVIAVANPLRGLAGDADYLRGILDTLERPAVLVGHSYAGMVITQAGTHPRVRGLVYVGAFAPEVGESAAELMTAFPGSTLTRHLTRRPIPGGAELIIRREAFVEQFAADVPPALASTMSVTQRPITETAFSDRLAGNEPGWRVRPSWFVYGEEDRSIPKEALSFMAERAMPVVRRVLCGGSHAVPVSQPDAVADVIIDAASAERG